MDVIPVIDVKLFSNRYSYLQFCLILAKLGTHDLRAKRKNMEQILKILILKILAIFF